MSYVINTCKLNVLMRWITATQQHTPFVFPVNVNITLLYRNPYMLQVMCFQNVIYWHFDALKKHISHLCCAAIFLFFFHIICMFCTFLSLPHNITLYYYSACFVYDMWSKVCRRAYLHAFMHVHICQPPKRYTQCQIASFRVNKSKE